MPSGGLQVKVRVEGADLVAGLIQAGKRVHHVRAQLGVDVGDGELALLWPVEGPGAEVAHHHPVVCRDVLTWKARRKGRGQLKVHGKCLRFGRKCDGGLQKCIAAAKLC